MTISPTPQLLGFGGLLESGKDAVSDHLVTNNGFTKVSMSDPIDLCVLAVNPIVFGEAKQYGLLSRLWRALLRKQPEIVYTRYREIHDRLGYVEAKRIPEVRALLQRVGKEMGRDIIDIDIWTNLVRRTVVALLEDGHPVCISGIRFVEEQIMVKELGGQLIWVDRPGHKSAAVATTAAHATEVQFADFDQDLVLVNDGTLVELHDKAEGLVR